jgi:hypothetical protein
MGFPWSKSRRYHRLNGWHQWRDGETGKTAAHLPGDAVGKYFLDGDQHQSGNMQALDAGGFHDGDDLHRGHVRRRNVADLRMDVIA